MRTTGAILLCLAALPCGGCSDDGDGERPDPVELVRERFPECEGHIDADNPQVRNDIIRFDCGAAVDGPLYYLDARDGSLISTCGGACFTSDPDQLEECQTLCPPPDWPTGDGG